MQFECEINFCVKMKDGSENCEKSFEKVTLCNVCFGFCVFYFGSCFCRASLALDSLFSVSCFDWLS